METAGDCYIVAGALMRQDEEGFLALEDEGDAQQGAERVMAFAKVRAGHGADAGWTINCDKLRNVYAPSRPCCAVPGL